MDAAKIRNGLLGAVLGDALGVPVEFKSRIELERNPVTELTGYGTFNLPPGTWSDDTSMTLITLESLSEKYNPTAIMNIFCKWVFHGYMTPYGKTFSIGKTTLKACENYKVFKDLKRCGQSDERSNGNGSLMRMLPVAIYFAKSEEKEIISKSFEISELTHAHIRSKIACAYFSLIVSKIINGVNLYEALAAANRAISHYIPEGEQIHFKRILDFEIVQLNKNSIKSSGYVIDTLESALWCLLNSSNYNEAVLKAVNLGDDTDTTATVTGGLAGIMYGLNSVSNKWFKSLAKIDMIEKLIDDFTKKVI